MKCAWQELLSLLPPDLRQQIPQQLRDTLQEIRLRLGQPVQLVAKPAQSRLPCMVTEEMLSFVVNAASRYSPWLSGSMASGYLTAPGGHRVGLCGDTICKDGQVTGLRQLRSLNIRVARDFPGLSQGLDRLSGSVLLIGPPGSGKTTLLRDLIRRRASRETVGVVDERGELFPFRAGFSTGEHTDILTGSDKARGIENLLRTMSPNTIAVDEISGEEDCKALLRAGWCGVCLLATAHVTDPQDLRRRPIYRALIRSGIFTHLVILDQKKTWRLERMVL